MTKSALVFSGIPRLLDRSRINFLENLININDVDMYSYVWRSHEYEKVAYCYRNKDIELIEPKNFDHLGQNKFNIYPHWYSVQTACRTFLNYARKHNLHYDLVIRTRNDIVLFNHVDLSTLDPNLIYVSDCHWLGGGTEIFDDNLMIMNMENYEKICGHAYDWYISRPDRHNDDVSEVMLSEYIRSLGYTEKLVRNPKLDFILTRGVI